MYTYRSKFRKKLKTKIGIFNSFENIMKNEAFAFCYLDHYNIQYYYSYDKNK